jgi:hypothetical protein
MLNLTLTHDRAAPMLLLKHQTLQVETYYRVCVLQNGTKGDIYRVPGSVP